MGNTAVPVYLQTFDDWSMAASEKIAKLS